LGRDVKHFEKLSDGTNWPNLDGMSFFYDPTTRNFASAFEKIRKRSSWWLKLFETSEKDKTDCLQQIQAERKRHSINRPQPSIWWSSSGFWVRERFGGEIYRHRSKAMI